jgi:hypothetical protein
VLEIADAPAVISALAPTRASAATASARRHRSGSGATTIPARSTPSIARMFSTMFGICTPMTASTGKPMRRSRPAIAATMRSASA